MKRRALLALTVFALGCKKTPHPPLRVAAAADLAHAFDELSPAFSAEASPQSELKLTLGASGLLARQLTQGAPFDLFLSADVGYVDRLVKAGVCDGTTAASYARGRLVIWVKGAEGARLTLVSLSDARFKHVAIANPEHAPYGKAAREALTRAGVWDALKARIVYGENVQQTFELARSGNADAAIVGLSLAVGTPRGSWSMVDEALYAPIEQALVVCSQGTNAAGARRLKAFIESARGRAILRKSGFLLPGETWALAP
ncbi:MAG TPA: molybdate ABC transporter substrate-binding protein [Polyangiaceae bacterium]|nr:molybdate ABC transporter substrate-binding protein [Polyangiaceae bacterium]